MRTWHDITCGRCGLTESCELADPEDLIETHVCVDGKRSDSFTTKMRRVPGPGERLSDERKS
jgi:hypothetical protein